MKFKKGDIFNDGSLGYWIFEPKSSGDDYLMLLPLDRFLFPKQQKTGCQHFWHDPKTWVLDEVEIICNLYDNPEQAQALVGDGNSLQERLTELFMSNFG